LVSQLVHFTGRIIVALVLALVIAFAGLPATGFAVFELILSLSLCLGFLGI
jgi:hypothetical protein